MQSLFFLRNIKNQHHSFIQIITALHLETKLIRICLVYLLRWRHVCQNLMLIFGTDTFVFSQTYTSKYDTYYAKPTFKCGIFAYMVKWLNNSNCCYGGHIFVIVVIVLLDIPYLILDW